MSEKPTTMLAAYLHGSGIATPSELAECIDWLNQAGAELPTDVECWQLTICNWRVMRELEAGRRERAA